MKTVINNISKTFTNSNNPINFYTSDVLTLPYEALWHPNWHTNATVLIFCCVLTHLALCIWHFHHMVDQIYHVTATCLSLSLCSLGSSSAIKKKKIIWKTQNTWSKYLICYGGSLIRPRLIWKCQQYLFWRPFRYTPFNNNMTWSK